MVEPLNVRSICDTCIYRSDCLSLKNTLKEGTLIFHCEEFESQQPKRNRDYRVLSDKYIRIPSFSMKNLIPGWSA